MRQVTRWVGSGLWLSGLLGLVVFAPACDDSAAPACDCDPAIAFLSPTGGALTEFHDQDANELGIQVDVRLRTHCIPDGTRLQYTNTQVPGEQVEGLVVLDDAATGDGHVDLGLQTFLEGSNRVCAAGSAEVTWMVDGQGSCSAHLVDPVEGCKDVLVQLGLPACRFDVPQDGVTLTVEEDASGEPGFQHDVLLTCKGIDDGALLALWVGEALPLEQALSLASASFTAVDLAEGLNLLRAEVTDPDGNPVGAEISVIVDTGGCAVRLLPPDGSVLRAADDLDAATAGLQTRMQVETDADGSFACPDGAVVTLDVDGVALQGVLAGGRAEFEVTLADGTHQVFATAAAPGGPEGRSLTHEIRVCATPVGLTLESPAEHETVTDAMDRDPATMGIQVIVSGSAAGVSTAEDMWLELDGAVVESGGQPVHPVVFQADGHFEFQYLTFLQSREYALQVKARNACDEEGMSAVHQVPVITEQLTCQLVLPADGAVLLLADDQNADPADGLQTTVQVVTANVPDGFTFDLHIGGQDTLLALPIQADGWTGEVTLLDGEDKGLWCELQTHEVSPMVSVTVDTVPPTVDILEPPDLAVFGLVDIQVSGTSTDAVGQLVTVLASDGVNSQGFVGTVAADGSFSLPVTLFSGDTLLTASLTDVHGNPASDAITVTAIPCAGGPGITFLDPDGALPEPVAVAASGPYDVQVRLEEFIPGLNAVELRVVQGAVSATYTDPTWSGDVATFAGAQLPNGQVTLEILAANSCDTILRQLLLFVGPANAPSVVITAPADNTCGELTIYQVTAQTTNATGDCLVCVQAYDPLGVPECTAALGGQVAPLAGGICTLDVDLGGEGDYQLWASVPGDLGTVGTSLPVRVLVDLTPPTVAITDPAADLSVGAAYADFDPVTAGFQMRLEITADVPDGTPVTVAGVDAVIGAPTFTNGVIYVVVTLLDGPHAVTAGACDCAGHCGTSPPRNILVDRQAPTVTITIPVNGAVLGQADDASAAPGFQLDVRCQFSNAAAGDTVTLSSNVNGAGWAIEDTHVLLPGEIGGYTFFAVDLLPAGLDTADVELRCGIVDPVANADSDTISVSVILIAPVVSVSRPLANAQLNIFSDMCPAGGLQTQVDIQTQGTLAGDDLRLCVCVGACTPDAGSPDECTQLGYGVELWAGQVSGPTTIIPCVPFPEGAATLRAFAAPAGLPDQGTYSDPVSVTVDSLPPTVDMLTVLSDADGNGCLRLAEGGLQLQAVVSDQGSGVEGRTATLYRNWPPGSSLGTAIVTGGVATFSVPLAEGDYDLTVVLSDAFNNPNIRASNPVINDPEAWLLLPVDRTAPSLLLTSPNKSTLLKADDTLDPATDALELSLAVSTSAEDGQVVTFGPMGGATATVAGGVASRVESLGQGNVTLTANVNDACGNPAVQASRAVLVDTLAPTLACSQPPDGFSSAQQSVAFVCATSGTDATQNIVVSSSVGGQRCQVPVNVAGTTSFNCNLAPGLGQTLTVTTRDPAGNPASDSILNVSVTIAGCDLAFQGLDNPELWNRADDLDGNAANGLQQNLTACSTACTSGSCPACRLRLLVGGAPFGAPVAPDASGCATWSGVTLASGAANVDLQAEIDDQAGHVTLDVVTVELVDLVLPTLARVRPGADIVYCVASSGNLHLDDPNTPAPANYVRDKVAGGVCDMDFELTVTDDQIGNGFEATLTLEEGGSPIQGPTQVFLSPENVVYLNTQLAHDQVHALVARVRDYAGNEATLNLSVTADVQAPAMLAATAALGADPAATRHADVVVGWSAVGDDGATGTPAAYVVRWSRAAIGSEARWFYNGTTWPNQVLEVQNGAAVGANLVLPPLNDYHVAVRAVDEVGNQSPIHADVLVGNMWNQAWYPAGSANFGEALISLGDINNDGREDVATTQSLYSTNRGALWVFFGAADLSTWSTTALRIEGRLATERFGWYVTSGDFDGDGIKDIAVSSRAFETNRGRVSIYFGRADFQTNPPAAPDIELRDAPAATGRFSRHVVSLGDINADGYDDLYVSAPAASGNGRGYIFLGRPRSVVDPLHPELFFWLDTANYASGLDADAIAYVPASRAEVKVLGEAAGDDFGYRWGATGLGDVDGDGSDDVFLVASWVNKGYTFDGAALNGIRGRDVSPASAPAGDSLATLTYGVAYTDPSGFRAGFGVRSVGGFDYTGDGLLDLVVGNGVQNRFHLFQGATNAGQTAIQPTALSETIWPANLWFGYELDGGDINMDNLPDIMVGHNSNSSPGAFIYLNSGAAPFLGPQPASILAGTNYFGLGIAIGNFDGDTDGLPDIAVSASDGLRVYY